MELSQLRAFVATSRERNIARAAEALNLTASPVSRTIKDLEKQLGGDLFIRAYHDLQLTELGERMLPAAVRIVTQADAMLPPRPGREGLPRVGATPWVPARFIDDLHRVAGEVFERGVDFDSDVSSVLLNSLRHGALDVAIVHLPVEVPEIATRVLGRYDFQAIVMSRDPLAQQGSIVLADLQEYSVLTMPRMMQPIPMAALHDRLAEHGVRDQVEVDLRDFMSIRSRLRHPRTAMLTTTAPDAPLATTVYPGEATLLPIRDLEIDFLVGVAWREPNFAHGGGVDEVVQRLHPPPGAPPVVI
ncbi:LysR family transcriptional regulator [Agromyces tropicus]